MKALLLIHRYLGIALGVLMVVWCLSGIVMMYVPYPHITEAERVAYQPPLNGARLLEEIDHDQWTVQGAHGPDRPLLHFSLDDGAGTEVYVSSVTGKAVQVTNARQRFWNWLGAVPHWIYFSSLRQYPGAWSQVVIWTSLPGTFLTLTGLYIGVRHLRTGPGVRWIPYRGLHYWHHVLGLVCGVFLLTWVFTGLMSMDPWDLFDNGTLDAAARLHRIDFSAAIRASPAREVFMVTTLVGMALVAALGTYLGLRRVNVTRKG